MIAIIKNDSAESPWPVAEDDDQAPAKVVTERPVRRPYDWSNIAFAVEYCEKTKREYEEQLA